MASKVKDYWSSEEGLNKVMAWARRGLNDEQIFTNMNVSKTTFYDYIKSIPNFLNSLKEGRENSLVLVENALFKSALGFSYDEVTCENGIETKRVTKHSLPNLGAQIFILKNRLPKSWQDKIITPEDEEAISKVETMLVNVRKAANDIKE